LDSHLGVRVANSPLKCWEWADKMRSNVWITKEEVKQKTNRKDKAGNEQPLLGEQERIVGTASEVDEDVASMFEPSYFGT
jgi:hypothetical protein